MKRIEEREGERERRTRNDNKRLWNVKKERLTMTTMTKWRKINNLLAVRFVRRRERTRCTPQWDFFFSASRHFHVFHSKHFFPFIISAFFLLCVFPPCYIHFYLFRFLIGSQWLTNIMKLIGRSNLFFFLSVFCRRRNGAHRDSSDSRQVYIFCFFYQMWRSSSEAVRMRWRLVKHMHTLTHLLP